MQFDNTIQGASKKAESIFQEKYNAIYKHLSFYKGKLSSRNKAETGIRYEWYALQRWGAKYWDDFNKPKIMWKIIGCNINFCFDDKKIICNNSINIMTGQEKQLLQFISLMNSKLFDWYLKLTSEAEVQGGGIQLYATTLENTLLKLNFPQIDIKVQERIKGNINDIQMDLYIYNLYNLSDEEKKFIINI